MKKKIAGSLLIIASALLLCMGAVLPCSAAAENAVDLANTPNHDGWLDACTLPDGGLVLAGFTEIPAGEDPDRGRILCLNPDGTVRWTYTDPEASSYGTVRVRDDGTIAAYYYNGVQFFTPDGKPAGENIPLPYTSGNVYDITSSGILRARRGDDEDQAGSLELVGWDGKTLFRIDEPESMWVGSAPIDDKDGLVFFGQEAGDPAEAPAVVMKVDLQGNVVWKSVMPFLSDKREYAGVRGCCRTSDGGYLAVLWDIAADPETGAGRGQNTLIRLDSAGNPLWIHPSDLPYWEAVEYDGKIVGCTLVPDRDSNRSYIRCLWLDMDGNELGTTELRLRDEDLPPYVDPGNTVFSVEKLIPAGGGLWQVLCFWDTDEPEEEDPAWTQQDNLLLPVPEL